MGPAGVRLSFTWCWKQKIGAWDANCTRNIVTVPKEEFLLDLQPTPNDSWWNIKTGDEPGLHSPVKIILVCPWEIFQPHLPHAYLPLWDGIAVCIYLFALHPFGRIFSGFLRIHFVTFPSETMNIFGDPTSGSEYLVIFSPKFGAGIYPNTWVCNPLPPRSRVRCVFSTEPLEEVLLRPKFWHCRPWMFLITTHFNHTFWVWIFPVKVLFMDAKIEGCSLNNIFLYAACHWPAEA